MPNDRICHLITFVCKQRLKNASDGDFSRTLLCGLPIGYGGLSHPIAVTIIRYNNNDSISEALRVLPYGVSVIGVVEFESDEEQDVYAVWIDIKQYL